jgi:N-acetylglucosaminyldiphosphoundecaprenol N-acetyl-beta-D-mannosaminyltransferase
MDHKEVAGLKITVTNKKQLLEIVKQRILSGKKTFATTPYSEFLFEAMTKPKVKEMLNTADISTPDGIGIFWAAAFLEIPLTAHSYYLRICQALWQAFYSLLAVLFYPNFIRKQFPEKIVGADLIWDLSEMASQNNFSVYFLGGFGETSQKAAAKLKQKIPNLQIAGCSSKNPDDQTTIAEINRLKPDLLFVAYGPIRQEEWIKNNIHNLSIKYAVGLGGTFDYLAGKVALRYRFSACDAVE